MEEEGRKVTWQRRLETAQKEHRPKLKDWDHDGFGHQSRRKGTFDLFAANAAGKGVNNRSRADTSLTSDIIMSRKTVDRVSARNLSLMDFVTCYEAKELPCIIADVPEVEGWAAWPVGADNNKGTWGGGAWSLANLKRKYADCRFKCGEDDDGYAIKVKLRYFLKYLENSSADSPLYVFDSRFVDNAVSKRLLTEFSVPSYFPDDLFGLVGERRRPPYRWFLLGPQRSGTCVHIDPLATSAWNTLISGRKYWAIFPPHVSKRVAKCWDQEKDDEGDEAVNYFIDFLPRLRRKLEARGEPVPFVEFVQEPGDTVFVPGGWWHAVLNLEHSVAITQNYCSRQNFDACWKAAREGRKKMAAKWLRVMTESDSSMAGGGEGGWLRELADRARAMNEADSFVMAAESSKRKVPSLTSAPSPCTSTSATTSRQDKSGGHETPSSGFINTQGRSDRERVRQRRGSETEDRKGSTSQVTPTATVFTAEQPKKEKGKEEKEKKKAAKREKKKKKVKHHVGTE